MKAMILHGGVGKVKNEKRDRVEAGLKRAIEAGYKILCEKNDALVACETAVNVLEDEPVFNAGTGAVLTLDGRCELDAAIVKGSTLEAGAVAGVENIKNPISLARMVMEKTDHVLLIGDGANNFARLMGIPDYNPITEERLEEWRKLKSLLIKGEPIHWKKIQELIKQYPELLHGTVGCVAIDDNGEIVAGTSTGGVFLKLFGRVGDTPILGAGTYATPFGGASCTGIGEGIMRTLLAKTACDFMKMGISAQKTAEACIDLINNTVMTETGIITLDKSGKIGFAHNAENMPVAFVLSLDNEIKIAGFSSE
ncbi:MAG TPA: isoaspartyl peptidase/L-asparaginase family protein [Candidatus Hydrothermia bacterium]|nr:isoaspartyl peptidase/L-asparaginase family protein [Candidatus Hydrothermia bacterium]